jgi:elongation factor G
MSDRPLENLRNIGISAHIDSGKTTLTERILYYTGRIHAIHEVRGKDGVGAKMDHMELEREKGITITSACTQAQWGDKTINIIDTPGHVDFTIEVERALRVLDGAILVLCGVSGVQSQSITVDRQMKRYKVPRIAFINKLDRTGANPFNIVEQLEEKLGLNAVAFQIPIGLEDDLKGVVDLVEMKSFIFEGENGENIIEGDIPDDLKDLAEEKREIMLDKVSAFSEEIMELMLEEKDVPADLQKMLDYVAHLLPNPYDVDNIALDIANNEEPVVLESDDSKDFVGYIFKLEDGAYGQLSYMRVYQGKLEKGTTMINQTTKRKHNVGRLIRMHSNETEEITVAGAGDIVAVFGIDCATGTTFTDGKHDYNMTSMFVPDPVIDVKIDTLNKESEKNLSKGLNRFMKEDPTFKVRVDEESSETIISGMGELHLEVYVERLKREYNVELEVGKPQVAYRETITTSAPFDYTHKKQTGGSGQFGKVQGQMDPSEEGEGEYEFVNEIKGGNIPKEYIGSVDAGFQSCMEAGNIIGFPIVNIRMTLQDGAYHDVDSSDMAFNLAAIGAFRQAYAKASPVILEPLMKVEIETPTEFTGTIMGNLSSRRGIIVGSVEEEKFSTLTAEVPLSEMFGYVGDLRSMSQGKAEYTMEFAKYAPVPRNIAEDLKTQFKDRVKGQAIED